MVGEILLASGAATAGAALTWHACTCRTSALLGPVVLRGPQSKPQVALTFDDGPTPPFTGEVLDILAAAKLEATFFVCGRNGERYPELLARMVQEGHAVANHSHTHPYFYLLSRNEMAREIDATEAILRKATGKSSRFFRPPYGARWPGLYSVLRERGLQLVHWSHAGEDWRADATEIAELAVAGLQPGSIILLHDGEAPVSRHLRRLRAMYGGDSGHGRGPAETVKALPRLIERVRDCGLEFARLDEMISSPAECRQFDAVVAEN